MKKYLFLLIYCHSLLILSFASIAYSATYYVKNSGNDSASGLSDDEAWKTIGKVNSFNFSSGDTVCLKRGDTFNDASFRNAKVDNFTIRDYGDGSKPHIDGNVVCPINIKDTQIKNLTIRNIDISGEDYQATIYSNLYVNSVENLTISGIDGDGHRGAISYYGKNAITVRACSGSVVIENCNLYNWGPKDLLSGDKDLMGIVIFTQDLGNYTIRNNVVHDIAADGIHLYDSSANGVVSNNVSYNCGEQSLDIKGSNNIDVFSNEFYRTADFTGQGGSGGGDFPMHIHIHEGSTNCQSLNVTLYENLFRDGNAGGILTASAKDVSIENNKFQNISTSIFIGNLSYNITISKNIFTDPGHRPCGSLNLEGGCIYENNAGTGTKIYNNSFYNGIGSCKSFLTLGCSYGTEIYRNVFYNKNSTGSELCLRRNNCGTAPDIHENGFYVYGGSKRIQYSSILYQETDLSNWNIIASGDFFSDPLFVDASKGDLKLRRESLCKTGDAYWGALGAIPLAALSALSAPSNIRMQQ